MGFSYEHALQTWMFGDMQLDEMFHLLEEIDFSADLCIHERGYSSPAAILAEHKSKWQARKISSCTAMFTEKHLNLSDCSFDIRANALDFAKKCVDAAAYIGVDKMLVSPSCIVDGAVYSESREADWKRGVESLYAIAEYASQFGISLMIEPINRYRVSLVHTVAEAIQMADEVGLSNVGLVPDIFHMCIEETDGVHEAIRKAGDRMLCLHLGGNTRCVPGKDSYDWLGTFKVLNELGYYGTLSYEPVKLYFNKNTVLKDSSYREQFLNELRESRKYLETISMNY